MALRADDLVGSVNVDRDDGVALARAAAPEGHLYAELVAVLVQEEHHAHWFDTNSARIQSFVRCAF